MDSSTNSNQQRDDSVLKRYKYPLHPNGSEGWLPTEEPGFQNQTMQTHRFQGPTPQRQLQAPQVFPQFQEQTQQFQGQPQQFQGQPQQFQGERQHFLTPTQQFQTQEPLYAAPIGRGVSPGSSDKREHQFGVHDLGPVAGGAQISRRATTANAKPAPVWSPSPVQPVRSISRQGYATKTAAPAPVAPGLSQSQPIQPVAAPVAPVPIRLPAEGSAFAAGAGLTGPYSIREEDDENVRRAKEAYEGLTPKQRIRVIKKEAEHGKRLSKIIREEGKTEKQALELAMTELSDLQTHQKNAIRSEARVQTMHSKRFVAFKKTEAAYLTSKREYDTALGELNAEAETLKTLRNGAQLATQRIQDKSAQVDSLRQKLAVDEREREVRLSELKGSRLWKQ